MAIPTETTEIISEENVLSGNSAQVLDGSEFANNNAFQSQVNSDDEFIRVAKLSNLTSVVSDFVTPIITYPIRKIEDILVEKTTLGQAVKKENELKNKSNFIGPAEAGDNLNVVPKAITSIEPKSYFNITEDSVNINLSQIIPSKDEKNKGIPVAKKLMAEAAAGQRGKRGPLTVIANGDGTFKLMDGNATYFAAKDIGMENVPVRVLTEEQYLQESAALKIRKAEEKKNAANFQANKKPVNLEDGMLSDFRAVGAAGDAKIPNEGNILATIESVSLTYKDKITDATRGRVTEEATKLLADELGVNPNTLKANILGRQQGGVITSNAGLAETMLASRELLISEVRKLDELALKAETGNNQDILDFRVQLELVGQLQSQIKGAQTEIARALGSFKIPVRGGDFDKTKADNIQTVLNEYGGDADIKDMARMYLQSGDSNTAKLMFANKGTKFQKLSNAMYEAWINILLSSGITHVKNISGNILTTLAHVGESYVAGGIGSVKRAMGGEGGAYIGEGNAQLFAGIMVLREAFSAAGTSFKHGTSPFAGSKLQGQGGKPFGNEFSAEGFEATGMMGNVADIVGNFMTLGRVPTRALEFEDTFFKVMANRMSLYQQAYRSGKEKGLSGNDLSNHIGEYVFNPPDVAVKEAQHHAKYVTLQTELDKVGKGINAIRQVPGMRYFLPFFKTPYNAFKYAAIDRGPIGFFYGESKAAIDAAKKPGASASDKAKGQLAQAKLYLGNATGLTLFSLAAEGNITGGGPADADLRSALRRTGWQPYSIRVGDTYYSYAAAEPFSSILALSSDVAEAIKSGDADKDTSEAVMSGLLAALGNSMTEKTFMQGFSGLMKALQNPDRYAGSTAENFWKSIVPRVVAQTKKNIDPMVRATYTKLDLLKAQIPYLSNDLLPRRNFWGQKIMLSGAYGPDILSPVYSSTIGPNNLAEQANELVDDPNKTYAKRAYAMDQEFVALRFGPAKHHETWDANVGLTAEEVDKLHQYSGIRSLEALEQVIKTSEYQNLKTAWLKSGDKLARETAETMLNSSVVGARAKAKMDLLEDSNLGQGVRDRLEKSITLQKKKANKMMDIMR